METFMSPLLWLWQNRYLSNCSSHIACLSSCGQMFWQVWSELNDWITSGRASPSYMLRLKGRGSSCGDWGRGWWALRINSTCPPTSANTALLQTISDNQYWSEELEGSMIVHCVKKKKKRIKRVGHGFVMFCNLTI